MDGSFQLYAMVYLMLWFTGLVAIYITFIQTFTDDCDWKHWTSCLVWSALHVKFSPLDSVFVVFLVDSFLNWNWSIINCTVLLLRKIRDNIVCSTNTSHAEFMDGVIKIYQMWSVCHPIFSIWFCQCWHWNLAMRAGCLPDPELFFPFVLCSKYFSL